jgi:hypothetical protein
LTFDPVRIPIVADDPLTASLFTKRDWRRLEKVSRFEIVMNDDSIADGFGTLEWSEN